MFLAKYIKYIQSRSIPESRVTIFRGVIKINTEFEGGKDSEGLFHKMENWFYCGFNIINNFSWTHVAIVVKKKPK